MADALHLRLLTDRVRTWNRWYRQHSHIRPDFGVAALSGAQLHAAQLRQADFHQANLRHAQLSQANLRHADLRGADLRGANLVHADLSFADLTDADLSYANLSYVNLNQTLFKETNLTKTRLHHALLRETVFANVDLSTAIGLSAIYHLAPSSIGTDTISRLGNTLPERFLRHANMHENLLVSIFEQRKAAFDYVTTFMSFDV